MTILALETANEQCSVALSRNGQILFFQQHHEPRAQTQHILPMIEQAMRQNHLTWVDLTAVAFSRGPGSFSGVRINATVTQALAWVHHLPVVAVSTLQALAQHAYHTHQLHQVSAVIDARMNEVYIANFHLGENGIMQLLGEEKLLNYAQALAFAEYPLVGSGTPLLMRDHSPEFSQISADAQDIAYIAHADILAGRTVSAAEALPVYLRDNAWKKIGEQGKSSS